MKDGDKTALGKEELSRGRHELLTQQYALMLCLTENPANQFIARGIVVVRGR